MTSSTAKLAPSTATDAAQGVRALLDDSFVLALIGSRGHGPQGDALRRAVEAFAPGTLGISAISVAALHQRALRTRAPDRNRAALAQFLIPLEVVPFGAGAAAALAAVEPQRSGEARLVAAQALALDAEVLTCAPDLYSGMAGVRVRALDVEASRVPPVLPAAGGMILAVGSHDLSLDLLGERLHVVEPGLSVCTAHVGSLDGLLALQRGEAHLAGSHLLDEASGEYNGPHIRRLLTPHGVHVVLVGFVTRVQGLMVARGNPKGIESLADLGRVDVVFVNRRQGSGTRVLLDQALRRQGMDPALIQGYGDELPSHAAVAAVVASGAADCGLGIQAAAQAHGLDFVPLFDERYDLVIPVEHYESALLAPLLALLRRPDRELLRAVSALGGYTTERMGQVLAEY